MTTRGQINSNFYQIVDVDANGNPTSVKNTYLANANVNHSNSATTANTVTTGAQPNITSLGTLTTLTSTGNITAPFFIGNVVGNIIGNLVVPGSNTDVLFNNEGNAGASDNFTFNSDSNILTVTGTTVTNILTVNNDALITGNLTVDGNTYYTNVEELVVQDPIIVMGGGPNGDPLTSNDGKDRGTQLQYYTTEPVSAFMGWDNSGGEFIFGSNVTNTSEVITVNTYGNVRVNSIIGNGAQLTSLTGANVTGQVSFAAVANSVSVSNVSGIGNIATVNLDGNVSNVLSGTGTWIAAGGGGTPGGTNTQVQFNDGGAFGGNASFTFDKTTGILTATGMVSNTFLSSTNFGVRAANGRVEFVNGGSLRGYANAQGITGLPNVYGAGMTATQFTSNATTGTAPLVINSTTQVANLNVATAGVAGTVTTNAQPNITSTGTLVSLSVTGNVAAGNISSSGLGNVANVVFTKYNESVVAGGSVTGTITPDVATGTVFNYTLTGNITLNSLANSVAGSGCTLILTQGGSGSYTLTSSMLFLGGAKTLSTTVGAIDILSVFYDGTTYYASLGKGYA